MIILVIYSLITLITLRYLLVSMFACNCMWHIVVLALAQVTALGKVGCVPRFRLFVYMQDLGALLVDSGAVHVFAL